MYWVGQKEAKAIDVQAIDVRVIVIRDRQLLGKVKLKYSQIAVSKDNRVHYIGL